MFFCCVLFVGRSRAHPLWPHLARLWGLRSGPQWSAGSGAEAPGVTAVGLAGSGRGSGRQRTPVRWPAGCHRSAWELRALGHRFPGLIPSVPSTPAGLSELPGVFYPSFLSDAHPPASIHTVGSPVSARLSFGVPWFISSLSDFSSPHTLIPENPAPIQTPWVILTVAGAPFVHRCASSQGPTGVRGWLWRSGDFRLCVLEPELERRKTFRGKVDSGTEERAWGGAWLWALFLGDQMNPHLHLEGLELHPGAETGAETGAAGLRPRAPLCIAGVRATCCQQRPVCGLPGPR